MVGGQPGQIGAPAGQSVASLPRGHGEPSRSGSGLSPVHAAIADSSSSVFPPVLEGPGSTGPIRPYLDGEIQWWLDEDNVMKGFGFRLPLLLFASRRTPL